jgi:hypothetical protein
MIAKSVNLPVLNSLLFIRDAATLAFPDIDGDASFWSTPSCLAVSCLPDCDGETEVTIGPPQAVGRSEVPLVDLVLDTPSRRVLVEAVLAQTILEWRVLGDSVRLQVWTNGHRGTDFVAIGVG